MAECKRYYALILFLFASEALFGQYDTSSVRRFTTAAISTEAVGLTGLYFLWYADYPQSDFHIFDDSRQWEQVDKVGHAFSTYQITRLTHDVYRHFGLSRKQALTRSVLLSGSFITIIEVMDGFSEQWGFSSADFAANAVGVGFFVGQSLLWDQQRIQMKFSYHPTDFAAMRPELLGSNAVESMLKDYNGQTYWFSTSPGSYGVDFWPKWLMLSMGYGADGMLSGKRTDMNQSNNPHILRQRQVYFSLDIDLTQIRTRQKWLNTFFDALGVLKVPAPAIQWNTGSGNIRLYPLYF